MNRILASTTLTAAVALATSMSAQAADMPQVVKDNMSRAMSQHLEKCYGINAGQERLRRGRAFLRGPGHQGARHQVLRAAARRRLRQDPGRQPQGHVIAGHARP